MESQRVSLLVFVLLGCLPLSILSEPSDSIHESFLQCLSYHSLPTSPISKFVYTPHNASYESIYESTSQNLRILTQTARKPLFIVTPFHETHVQATVICCRKHGLQIKTRSGGHDFEGLSFTSDNPSFIILDLVKMKSIKFNLKEDTAWVQAGATNGELFYQLSQVTNTSGFPAGTYPSVGVGGLFSGGGMGTLLRKYGLAADHILDARMVDATGRILDKKSMGKDLFWAIRGGGGSSFGVILSWKIQLVPVPSIVTVFTVRKTLEQGASKLFDKWQYVGHKLPEDVFMRIMVRNVPGEFEGNRTIQIAFAAFFLGRAEELIHIMNNRFPELGATLQDCVEMSYVENIVYFANYLKKVPIDALINLDPVPKGFLKAKSDFVREPISTAGLEGLWKKCLEDENSFVVMDAFGGKMDEIPDSELPFPHRKGVLYDILYFVTWNDSDETPRQMSWIRNVYRYMAPYVSKSPRQTYANTRDLDIGSNKFGRKTTYSQAKVWGRMCFVNNFKRLAKVKGKVDPTNFFRHEQSIPPRRW